MAKTIQEQIVALRTRIEADKAKLKELEAVENAAKALANLKAGSAIEFIYGRAENRKQYAGVVMGIADTDKGTRIKVQYGEGFDAQIVVIAPGDVVAVAEEAAEAAAPNGGAAADPLADIE